MVETQRSRLAPTAWRRSSSTCAEFTHSNLQWHCRFDEVAEAALDTLDARDQRRERLSGIGDVVEP